MALGFWWGRHLLYVAYLFDSADQVGAIFFDLHIAI